MNYVDVVDSCKKTALVFDEAISAVDFVNCQSVQAQVQDEDNSNNYALL